MYTDHVNRSFTVNGILPSPACRPTPPGSSSRRCGNSPLIASAIVRAFEMDTTPASIASCSASSPVETFDHIVQLRGLATGDLKLRGQHRPIDDPPSPKETQPQTIETGDQTGEQTDADVDLAARWVVHERNGRAQHGADAASEGRQRFGGCFHFISMHSP